MTDAARGVADVDWRPGYLAGSAGALHCVHLYPRRPAGGNARGVVFCAPFAEELNRTRRTVRLAAEAFAASGHEVLIVDLYGTGDSAGEFAEARWDGWVEDLAGAGRWLREVRGVEHVVYWGLRTGAALAVSAAGHGAERLLLWQPVVSGRAFLTQFLRLRMLSDSMAGDGAEQGGGSNTGELRELLRAGHVIEVGGYALTESMCEALEAVDLMQMRPTVPVHWAEVVPAQGRPFSVPSRRLIEMWEGAGVWVDDTKAVGASFWSTPELTVSAPLIEHARDLGVAWREARGPLDRAPAGPAAGSPP